MLIMIALQEREPQMFTIQPWIRFTSTEQLRMMALKSGSRVFADDQTVVVTYQGLLEVKALAFFEICLTSTEMRYGYVMAGEGRLVIVEP
jgi:hypothetical protein